MPLLPDPKSSEESKSLDDAVTVASGAEDGSAGLVCRMNVVVCCAGSESVEDSAADRGTVDAKATYVVEEASAIKESDALDEDATGTPAVMDSAAGVASGSGCSAALLFCWYTLRDLTLQ